MSANPHPAAPGLDVVRELAPSGRLRAAINFGNTLLAQRDPDGGAPQGASGDLARELAARLGVPIDYVAFEGAGQVTAAAGRDVWDVAFLAIDPTRAEEIAFTAPYVLIEGTYLVPAASPLRHIEEVDRAGHTIAVVQGSAYDLFLTRAIKAARIRREGAHAASVAALSDGADATAGVRQMLAASAAGHPGHRLIDGRFMAIEQAMGTPQGRPAALAYLRTFVEDAKASGFVARALAASGQDAAVAPPARSA